VVSIGILGSVAGVKLLDPIAAAIVGFMVARMGWVFGWDAMQDLSDRAVDEETSEAIRQLILETPGVRGLHEMRTRKMGDSAIVDAHVIVDPLVSVSEGHYIAERVRLGVMTDHRVIDALIHIDPEPDDDETDSPTLKMPPRRDVESAIREELARQGWGVARLTLHYLSTGLEIEIVLSAPSAAGEAQGQPQPLDADEIARRFHARRVDIARAESTAA
jgi:hypothetical protein